MDVIFDRSPQRELGSRKREASNIAACGVVGREAFLAFKNFADALRSLETVNLPMIESEGNMVKQAMARGRMGRANERSRLPSTSIESGPAQPAQKAKGDGSKPWKRATSATLPLINPVA
ncbi:MAG: hypothetical protein ABSB42_19805 [Tepidisphaeraceae bacterium]